MTNQKPLTRWLRWIARASGTLLGLFYLLVIIGNLIGGPAVTGERAWTWEDTGMAILMPTTVIGVALAWWKEGLGSILLILLGVAFPIFAYFSAGHHHAFAMIISGGPPMIIGLLYLACWRLSRRDNR